MEIPQMESNPSPSKRENNAHANDSESLTNISLLLESREIDGAHMRTILPSLRKRKAAAHLAHASVDSLIRNNISFVSRMKVVAKLKEHDGCVNSVEWSEDGSQLITGSDDCRVNVWRSGPDYSLIHSYHTGHFRNIFSAKFVPNTNCTEMVSCGMDGEVRFLETHGNGDCIPTLLGNYNHMVYKAFFIPQIPLSFVTTHQDGAVRLFDLREKPHSSTIPSNSGEKRILLKLKNARRNYSINSVAFDPLGSYQFVTGGADPYVRLFDLRYLQNSSTTTTHDDKSIICKFCPKTVFDTFSKDTDVYRFYITGVDYNHEGEVVANYSKEDVYLFNLNESIAQADEKGVSLHYEQVYKGRRNVATFLKEVAFLQDSYSRSSRSSFLATGSDCGHVYIWEKKSGELVQFIRGDNSIVNGVTPHPTLPVLAVCGIDSYAKVIEPTDETTFDAERAKKVVDQNMGLGGPLHSDDEDEDDLTEDDFNLFQLILQALRSRQRRQHEPTPEEEEARIQRQQQIANEQNILQLSEDLRNGANDLFSQGKFVEAIAQYNEAERMLSFMSVSPMINEKRIEDRIHCLNNKAACYLKMSDFDSAVRTATEVLTIERNNYKALYRRAQAYLHMHKYDEAYDDIKHALERSPGDKPLKKLLKELKDAKKGSDNSNNNNNNVEMEDADSGSHGKEEQ